MILGVGNNDMKVEETGEWAWQLVMRDPSMLSGPSVAAVVEAVSRMVQAVAIIVRSVEGGGLSLRQIRAREDHAPGFEPAELLPLFQEIDQIDWGDFFFFSSISAARSLSKQANIIQAVPLAEVTLRCVDGGYFYFYGTSRARLKELVETFPISEQKEGPVNDLDFPY